MSRVGELSEKAGIRIVLRTKRVLFDDEDEIHGRILVIETDTFGRSLLLGRELTFQTTERLDVYDEALGHVSLNEHPEPRRVLIIGGGDGKIASIALKHGAEEVVILEIDERVVEISKKYLQVDDGALSDDHVKIIYGDAFETVESVEGSFDVIIGDYSDPYPDEPAKSLLGEEFIGKLKRILKPDGVIALQAGSPVFQKRMVRRVVSSLRPFFKHVKLFWAPMPVYPGAFWTFAIASDEELPRGPFRKISGEYYNRGIHRASFALPTFIAELQE